LEISHARRVAPDASDADARAALDARIARFLRGAGAGVGGRLLAMAFRIAPTSDARRGTTALRRTTTRAEDDRKRARAGRVRFRANARARARRGAEG